MDHIELVRFLTHRDILSLYCTSKKEKEEMQKYVYTHKIYIWWYSLKTRQWIDKVHKFVKDMNIMPHRTEITLPLNYKIYNNKCTGYGYPYCSHCTYPWKGIANCATYEVEGFKMRYAMPSLSFHCCNCFSKFEDNFNYEFLRNPIYTTYRSAMEASVAIKWNVLHYLNESDSDEVFDEH